jgi:hypothetical protein
LDWLKRSGFCHLKLHGAAIFPLTVGAQEKRYTSREFYGIGIFERLYNLVHNYAKEEVPALLPWEIVHDDGRLLGNTEFREAVGTDWQHLDIYPLFCGLWERARNEIQQATKISYVGLSLNDYLIPGLKYLFRGKEGEIQLVVATKIDSEAKVGEVQLPPAAAKAITLHMESVDANLQLRQSALDISKPLLDRINDARKDYAEPEVTVRKSFDDFLETELEITSSK